MKFTSPNMVPYQIFNSLKPEDFNYKNLEELIWTMGVGEQHDYNMYFPPERQGYYCGVNAWQLPCQLADFIEHLYLNKDRMNIDSYLEVGVHLGGHYYIMDSFFRSINSNFKYSTALDIKNYIFEFNNYKKKFNNVDFVLSDSLKYTPDRKYDLIYIDSNHTYGHVSAEFLKYKNYARYMAFHDINNPPYAAGVIKFWNEIKKKYPYWETTRKYIDEYDIMGIGLIEIVD